MESPKQMDHISSYLKLVDKNKDKPTPGRPSPNKTIS